ncbi:MAG: cobalamin biosynthesis protein [Propionibacteriaceae bacterium]|nr:cobalamin biosynthesis protein [Propionibacteriaceae bacterium]
MTSADPPQSPAPGPVPATIAAIAFSPTGLELGQRLARDWPQLELTRCPAGGLAAWTRQVFATHRALLFIGSVGLAVRACAPLLVSKTSDPAVLVVNETGDYVVAVLSGHIGQANQLARALAQTLGAIPVITTATDSHGLFAVDDWATRQGLRVLNPERIKTVSARLLAGQTIRLTSDFPLEGPWPAGVVPTDAPPGAEAISTAPTPATLVAQVADSPATSAEAGCDVVISCRRLAVGEGDEPLQLAPPALTAGIGCKRGTAAAAVERAFQRALAAGGYRAEAVGQLASLDLKADEPGLLEFARRRGLPLRTFDAAQLADQPGHFTASAFVAATTGVDNVCERAALAAGGGAIVVPKLAGDGVTVALALCPPRLAFDQFNIDNIEGEAE